MRGIEFLFESHLSYVRHLIEYVGLPSDWVPGLYQVDRMNNDGCYEAGNLVFSTKIENMRNRRNADYVTIEGESIPTRTAAEYTGVNPRTAIDRNKKGMSSKNVLTPLLASEQKNQSEKRDAVICELLQTGQIAVETDGRITMPQLNKSLVPGQVDRDGYLKVKIPRKKLKLDRMNISNFWFLHHRVVAIALLGKLVRKNAWIVNHRNGIRTENTRNNLDWVTHKENANQKIDDRDISEEKRWEDYYKNSANYRGMLKKYLASACKPKYTDHSPLIGLSLTESEKLLSVIKKRGQFRNENLQKNDVVLLQILASPSNRLKITEEAVTVESLEKDHICQVDIYGLTVESKVYLTCFECGYESMEQMSFRSRIRCGCDRKIKSNPCKICKSIAIRFPELDHYRRPNPLNGDFPNGLNVSTGDENSQIYVFCHICSVEIVDPIRLKKYWLKYKDTKRLPFCC